MQYSAYADSYYVDHTSSDRTWYRETDSETELIFSTTSWVA